MNNVAPSPISLVLEVLSHFGLSEPRDIVAWPFRPPGQPVFRGLLAKFRAADQGLVLKAKTVEHRGVKAVFETHYLQVALREHGVPVPALYSSDDGVSLVLGPDPRDTKGEHYELCRYLLGPYYYDIPAIYFEIQELVDGQRPSHDSHTWHRVGMALASFHVAGYQPEVRSYDPSERHLAPVHIDTHLFNKFMYVRTFVNRGVERTKLVRAYTSDLQLSGPVRRAIDEMFCRQHDLAWRSNLTRSIIHGDFGPDNLLVSGDEVYIIDLDEAGLGEVSFDLIRILSELQEEGTDATSAFLDGYRVGGATLTNFDRTAIIDGRLMSELEALAKACGEADEIEKSIVKSRELL